MLEVIYKTLGCSLIISEFIFIIFMIYVEILDFIENKNQKKLNKNNILNIDCKLKEESK